MRQDRDRIRHLVERAVADGRRQFWTQYVACETAREIAQTRRYMGRVKLVNRVLWAVGTGGLTELLGRRLNRAKLDQVDDEVVEKIRRDRASLLERLLAEEMQSAENRELIEDVTSELLRLEDVSTMGDKQISETVAGLISRMLADAVQDDVEEAR